MFHKYLLDIRYVPDTDEILQVEFPFLKHTCTPAKTHTFSLMKILQSLHCISNPIQSKLSKRAVGGYPNQTIFGYSNPNPGGSMNHFRSLHDTVFVFWYVLVSQYTSLARKLCPPGGNVDEKKENKVWRQIQLKS